MDNKYSANLTGEPFLWYEMRLVADLLVAWLDEKEIKTKVLNENLFQYKTLKSIPKRTSCVLKRLRQLDKFLLNRLSTWDNEDTNIISLYAIYKDSFLVYDFINEFIRDKRELKQLDITDAEILSYFNLKSREHIEMNKWTESTIKKIKQILKNILSWAWILEKREIKWIIISYSLNEYLSEKWEINFLNALWL